MRRLAPGLSARLRLNRRLRSWAWKERRQRHPEIAGVSPGVFIRPQPPCSLRVSPDTFLMAEPDRDRLRHRQSAGHTSRQLQITAGSEGPPARFRHLLQQHLCQTVRMELHRASRPKRGDQTAKHMEGKLGKKTTANTDFRSGDPTTMTCSTRY